jgi:uncharacterized membrane protein
VRLTGGARRPPKPFGMPVLIAAFLLGCVAGLRTFTAPAVLLLVRNRTTLAYVLGLLAAVEYLVDLNPKAPARTNVMGLGARAVSGAFCGWVLGGAAGGSPLAGAAAGVLGAVTGAYAGLYARTRAIDLIGRVPAAIAEDLLAIAGAILIVTFA